jgi:hypothetical protein
VVKTLKLVLIIYAFFLQEGFAQNLELKVIGHYDDETTLINTLGYQKNHKNFKSILLEVDSIQNQLYKLGYIENSSSKISRINDSTFAIKINLKHKYDTIYIYYNNIDIKQTTLKAVSKNVFNDYFVINITAVEDVLAFINNEVSKNGLPFSKIKLSNITIKDTSTLKANLLIDASNTKRILNTIVIRGYEKFPQSYITHFLKIKPKQVFDLNAIKNKTKQLNNLNFANEVRSPEVLFSKDSTTLYMYIKKTKSNSFDGFLGFGTNEETNQLEFDGYLNLNLTNNLNFGESFRLLYKSDENNQKTFETAATLPYLFKTPIGMDLQLRIFKKDSSFTTVNQTLRLHYQITPKHKIYSGIVSTESNNLLSNAFLVSISDYKTQHYTVAYQFLNQQPTHSLFPIKTKLYFEAGFGERKTTTTKENQSQYSLDASNIFNLNKTQSIFIKAQGSHLKSNTYFENELLRFGGINSIRGFEENSLFATLFGIMNTEYRYTLSQSLYVHSIFDVGYFENNTIKTKEKLFGYGFGFGILTKAGLLRFNYANGKSENSKFKLSNSKIHLSLTANF